MTYKNKKTKENDPVWVILKNLLNSNTSLCKFNINYITTSNTKFQ